ncbi:D-mannonate dehydratase [Clostridium sp. MCC353]|uniref:mannonate dehydratase n=1 Tax=Clostridium sp. MCC353 TaxID=2592646 RepID=UPI001C026E78|nr:mannonate dehydratase [Clostridium sp. MCC353]MBT9780109.1 D-mannonate dehydratase [Clostridium sp. MCC353]
MLGTKIRVQHKVISDYTDEQLLFLTQMGVKYVYVMFKDEHTDYDSVMRFMERLDKFGLVATDAGNTAIYKNAAMHLALPGRDEAIQRYNDFNRVLGKAGIRIVYMTWEPNQVLTTRFGVGEHTRGAIGRIVDIKELETHPYSHGRLFTKEEMWDNFKYFLDRVLPVCEEANVKIALHPNDPPVACLKGISNLITSAEDYKHAFELAGNSPYLGMKMCIGCWLEGGDAFGNVLEDIKYFVEQKKVLIVHFRNVSGTVPYFEETLLEDGYMDMYKVMKQFVSCDYDGMMHVDHVPIYAQSCGGEDSSVAYSLGYMKALLNCAIAEVNK